MKRFMTLATGTALVFSLLTATATTGWAQTGDPSLMVRSREATTLTEHASLAKAFRLQAESQEARAREHETRVQALQRQALPIEKKWPSMATGPLRTAKEQALAARRAARESRALAAHHLALAVESQSTTTARAE